MEDFKKQALDKLDEEFNALEMPKDSSLKKVISTIKKPVLDALKSFCRQDSEFAQAVVQGDSLSKCLAALANKFRKNGYALSDFDTYSEAAKFYFSEAKIRYEMTVEINGSNDGSLPSNSKAINVNFDDLFDF